MHRWSQLFIPTLREAPADAEVASHKLLLRAGYIRQLGAGIYSYLPLGQRALNKIVRIIREEMDRIGQEFHLPALNPAEVWQESGRWTAMGDNMFRLKDRKGAELALAMTHEEIMTSIARNELRSYKQLPQIWYQIQTKFRDEPRPKSGLLRVRQFLMKDSYSFDLDEAGLDVSYNKHDEAYRRIFTRCGLQFVAVEADSGAMGGSQSQEFMVYTEAGEDLIASSASGYAANLEKATSQLAPVEDLAPSGNGEPELLHTPGARTIDEVGAYLNQHYSFALSSRSAVEGSAVVQPWHQIKTMAYIATFPGEKNSSEVPVIAFLRGDHSVNETKLKTLVACFDLILLPDFLIEEVFGAPAGYLGPLGLSALTGEQFAFLRQKGMLPKAVADAQEARVLDVGDSTIRRYLENPAVILDTALTGRTNLICGANEQDYHCRNVNPRDFTWTVTADIRNVNEGDPDPIAGQPIKLGKAVEIGHIFKLGRKYTDSMNARVLNKDGKEVTPIMGSYGIGVERILTAAIESSAAAHKARFPDAEPATGGTDTYALAPSIAPFEVVVTITNTRDAQLNSAGEQLAAELDKLGVDVLLDDRDERAGVKFKDADLIGVPYRLNIGKKLADGSVEFVDRLNQTTLDLPVNGVAAHVAAAIQSAHAQHTQATQQQAEQLTEFFARMCAAFNRRDIDAVLAAMRPDVDWPNGWEGGRMQGKDAVREYWTRQWDAVDPAVEPLAIEPLQPAGEGRIAVHVHLLVKDKVGALVDDRRLTHVYTLRDGLVARMDIEETA